MTFKVDPEVLRTYAARLSEALAHAEAAESYVKANGNFSTYEAGLIGFIAPNHRSYVEALHQMLAHIAKIAEASAGSMQSIAETYERTDKHRVDSGPAYGGVPLPECRSRAREPGPG